MKTILVVAAHPDDEILGVGATIAKHKAQGDRAIALILGQGIASRDNVKKEEIAQLIEELEDAAMTAGQIIGYDKLYFAHLPDNQFDSINLLEIVKIIEKYSVQIGPDIIYTHHNGDLNIDHQLTNQAVLTATRPIGNTYVKEIYTFETLSSTEWNFNNRKAAFLPNVFNNIEDYMEQKIKAMQCYHSELCSFPHPRSLKGIEIAAQRWGMTVGMKQAEAFELIRKIID